MDIVEDYLTFWEKQLALLELWSFFLGTINGTIILNKFLHIRSFDFRGLIRKEMSLVIYPKSHWFEKYVKCKWFFYHVTRGSGLVVRCIMHPVVEFVYFPRFSHINSVILLSFFWLGHDMNTARHNECSINCRLFIWRMPLLCFIWLPVFETTEWVSKSFDGKRK